MEAEFQAERESLMLRQMRNDMNAWDGYDFNNWEEIDTYEVVSVMSEAYDELALGVHENVQSWSRGEDRLIRKVVTPTVYVNGRVAQTKTEFLNGNNKQPAFIQNYFKTRDAVYGELLEYGMQSKDLSYLLSTITTYREAELAKRFLGALHAGKERYPDMIAGDAEMILRRIDLTNQRVDKVKRAAGAFALERARRDHLSRLRQKLHGQDINLIQAFGVALQFKFGQPRNESKWRYRNLEKPIQRIAKLASVPEQLIAKEKEGVPITE